MLDVIQTVLAVLTFVIVALEFSSKMPFIDKVQTIVRPHICAIRVTVLHYMPRVIERWWQPWMKLSVVGCEVCRLKRSEDVPQLEDGLQFQDDFKFIGLASSGDRFTLVLKPKNGIRPETIEIQLKVELFGRFFVFSRKMVSLAR